MPTMWVSHWECVCLLIGLCALGVLALCWGVGVLTMCVRGVSVYVEVVVLGVCVLVFIVGVLIGYVGMCVCVCVEHNNQ